MRWNMREVFLVTVVFVTLSFAGCSSTPIKPQEGAVVFGKPLAVVQKASVDALVVTGFDIQRSEPQYVEGYRPRRVGLFVGSGGETVGIWLEPIDNSKTRVRVDTARTFAGGAGQRNWNEPVLEELDKTLGKRE
jgi:hypothetical protein